MYLSAERLAIANRAVEQTFEQASVAWQAIPHWDTGDPGQVKVRSDVTFKVKNQNAPPVPHPGKGPLRASSVKLTRKSVAFRMTLAQACAPTPDALLAAVMPRTVKLAGKFDTAVLDALHPKDLPTSPWRPALSTTTPEEIIKALIEGRRLVEDSGYRAPSCLIASTAYFSDLSQFVYGEVVTEELLAAGNVNSLHRASQLDGADTKKADTKKKGFMLMLGRRQRIGHGCAGAASPGEEPVDLAISVGPSLEVVGEADQGNIELAVRIRFAARVKDGRGVVVFHDP